MRAAPELTEAQEALLTTAEWTRIPGSAGYWRDPASGEARTAQHALELATKDACAALSRLGAAGEAVQVAALQLRLEAQRKLATGQDSTKALAAAREATERLVALGRELAAMSAGRAQ